MHVELCRDRACREVIRRVDARGGALAVAEALRGVVFWRLVSDAPGVAPTSARWFSVSAHPVDAGRVIRERFDVNGDGFADALTDRLFLGGATAPYLTAAAKQPPRDGAARLVSAGDVNGDGFSDLLVTAPRGGPMRLLFGGEGGVDPTPRSTLEAPAPSVTWGDAVAGVGDLNGDGYGDVVVGVAGRNTIYVYAGSAEGLAAQPAATLRRWPRCQGNLGGSVAALGDVNGDGLADFATDAYEGDGLVAIVTGAATWPTTPPAWVHRYAYAGGAAMSLRAAGDLDGDGFADAIRDDFEGNEAPNCGSPVWIRGAAAAPTEGRFDPAAREVLRLKQQCAHGFETSSGELLAVGDLDGDGFDDVLSYVVQPEGAARVRVIHGEARGPVRASAFAVQQTRDRIVALGDVDRDGFDDVALVPSSGAVALRLVRGAASEQSLTSSDVPRP